ncbi:MAG: hypothetical protein RMJ44_12095 [Cytophagales bacterium]|nr:hypothetical protein [Bernardetiaceae bacterium]MDW8211814.1 hypothetical protein [Cytophagales bacterium]
MKDGFVLKWAALYCLLFVAANHCLYAQIINDPLKKPALWAKVLQNPESTEVWTDYVGKKWDAMTPEEQHQVMEWKRQLLLQEIAEKEAIVTTAANPQSAKRANPVVSEEKAKGIADMESLMREEGKGLHELRANINENFVILEDMYRDIFRELGVEYVYYEQAHPKGDYSRIKWIEEQEARIKLLRENKIKQLKSSVISPKNN